MHTPTCLSVLVLGLAAASSVAQGNAQAPAASLLRPVPAQPSPAATNAPLLGAAWAGSRAVAVGEYGTVLLSDNGGAFRQAKSVPVSSVLTAVHFTDAQHGWAVGHWGAILASVDGGETWTIQRMDTQEDRPLFAVHFFNARQGVAVGLWSLVLTTDDGGKTWNTQTLPPPPGGRKADLNLLSLFPDAAGVLYATAERGLLLRSQDQGRTWEYFETGGKASLWAGAALPDGSLIVGGQGGSLLRSPSITGPWRPVPFESKRSVTDIAATPKEIWAVGLDGLRARSNDGGHTFAPVEGAGPTSALSLTAVLARDTGKALFFSRNGVARGIASGKDAH